ncbi:MAG: mobile mystery protein A [Pseudomonadota bacterium]
MDKRLGQLPSLARFARPPKGWIKSIREALGMTMAQLAERLGVSQPRIFILEQNEALGSITMESLERAANALDCDLAYVLIPREKTLEATIRIQSIKAAHQMVKSTQHTMSLENQALDQKDIENQVLQVASKLREKSNTKIWNFP